MNKRRIDRASVVVGTVGFIVSVVLALAGTTSGRYDVALFGAAVAALTAVTLVLLEILTPREVNDAQAPELVAETVPPQP